MPIVEMMGLPASGKSSLATEMLKVRPTWQNTNDAYWSNTRSDPRGIIERLLLVLPENICNPLSGPMSRLDVTHLFLSREADFAAIVFREAASLQNPLHRQSFLYAWLKYIVQWELMNRPKDRNKSVLVEEGFSHRAMTLLGYSRVRPEEELIYKYGTAMPKPQAVVWVDTPPELCAKRLRDRDQPPLPLIAKSSEQWGKYLETGRFVLATMAACLRELGVQIITVSGEKIIEPDVLDDLFCQLNVN